MYQKKEFPRFRMYIFFLVFVIFFIKFSTTHVYANTYEIEDLEISELYDLNFDKQNIINKAFELAFKELILKKLEQKDNDRIYNFTFF